MNDSDFEVPESTPTECLYCGHFARNSAERKHKCPVVGAINGANIALAVGWVAICLLAGFWLSGICHR